MAFVATEHLTGISAPQCGPGNNDCNSTPVLTLLPRQHYQPDLPSPHALCIRMTLAADRRQTQTAFELNIDIRAVIRALFRTATSQPLSLLPPIVIRFPSFAFEDAWIFALCVAAVRSGASFVHCAPAASASAAPAAATAAAQVVCPDGTRVGHAECCPFVPLAQDLQKNLFENECGEDAHEVFRLTFHDAITISQKSPSAGGGADGSFLLFPDQEPNFPGNEGTDDSVQALLPFLQRHNVTAGDLIQFAGAVAIGNCPGAPRLEFLAGRPNAKRLPARNLIPLPSDSVDRILSRFADAGNFSPFEVVSLLASHSIARADHVDPKIQAAPFDSTPFTFDTQVYLEVLLHGTGFPGSKNNSGEVKSPLPLGNLAINGGKGNDTGEMRLQSDFAISRDPRTACFWQGFVNQQTFMANSFKAAMSKLAVLGNDRAKLVDCSDVVPKPVTTRVKPASFPATKSSKDLELVCASPFPSLSIDAGPRETLIPHCPDGSQNCP
ncbi:Manganese peroxidase [Mycena indigotica]|uniref:Peroxidase n=1 Tax=Mycena indigotica TaxID=2126181 RepID=A0A8H6W3Z7_9AGAR|nr:Manganese peroxidase [Mycena indigotica]KAF7304097.1 Manganese peroxidase [Mycena indigotica]